MKGTTMKRRKYYFIAEVEYVNPTVSMHPMEQEYKVHTVRWLFRSISKECARKYMKNFIKCYKNDETEATLLSLNRVTKKEYVETEPEEIR